MNVFFSYACPRCKRKIPLVPGPSLWVRGEFMAPFLLRCPGCKTVCQRRVGKSAAITWPVAAVFLAIPVLLRYAQPFRDLYAETRSLYPIILGLCLAVALLGFLSGYELAGVEGDRTASKLRRLRGLIVRALAICGIVAAYGLLTDHWQRALTGASVGLLVYMVAYYIAAGKAGD